MSSTAGAAAACGGVTCAPAFALTLALAYNREWHHMTVTLRSELCLRSLVVPIHLRTAAGKHVHQTCYRHVAIYAHAHAHAHAHENGMNMHVHVHTHMHMHIDVILSPRPRAERACAKGREPVRVMAYDASEAILVDEQGGREDIVLALFAAAR